MKKVNFKNLLKALSLVAAFLLAGAGQVSAQVSASTSDDLYAAPQGSFVGTDEAMTLVTNHLAGIKDDLVLLTPGTAAYKAAEAAYFFYHAILTELSNGQAVPQAIVEGLRAVSSDASGFNVQPAQLAQLKAEATALLST